METSIFLLTLSVLAFFNALWIYKFYSMKRTYLKAGKCIVQLIDKVQKLETENKDYKDLIVYHQNTINDLSILNKYMDTKIFADNSDFDYSIKPSKKKANTKIGQKTKQVKIKGK